MPSSIARTLTVPVGMTASGTSLPAMPLTTSLTVPSPPIAQIDLGAVLDGPRGEGGGVPGVFGRALLDGEAQRAQRLDDQRHVAAIVSAAGGGVVDGGQAAGGRHGRLPSRLRRHGERPAPMVRHGRRGHGRRVEAVMLLMICIGGQRNIAPLSSGQTTPNDCAAGPRAVEWPAATRRGRTPRRQRETLACRPAVQEEATWPTSKRAPSEDDRRAQGARGVLRPRLEARYAQRGDVQVIVDRRQAERRKAQDRAAARPAQGRPARAGRLVVAAGHAVETS